jgi:hypothetical protein
MFLAAAIAAVWIAATYKRHGPPAIVGTSDQGLTIEQVQALSSLATMRINVADVVESDVSGYTGAMKAAIIVKGDVLLGVDLSQARLESVDRAGHTAVLVLPQPRPIELRLDHERSRVCVLCQTGLWQLAPGGGRTTAEVIDRGYREAQRIIARAGDDPSLVPRARRHAEQAISAFFGATGWVVSVRWQG